MQVTFLLTKQQKQKMKIEKIITHHGMFHADEIFSIALLRLLGINAPIERKKPTLEDLLSNKVMVLDTGGEYDTQVLNFDHHQDKKLESTNVLLLYYLEDPIGWLNQELTGWYKQLYNDIFRDISIVDRYGKDITIINEFDGASSKVNSTYNALITRFNVYGEEGFKQAVDFALNILKVHKDNFELYLEHSLQFRTKAKICDHYALIEDSPNMLGWRNYAPEDVKFLITHGRDEGTWQIISRNSNQWPIPPDEDQVFYSNTGFIAVYASKEDAIKNVSKLKK